MLSSNQLFVILLCYLYAAMALPIPRAVPSSIEHYDNPHFSGKIDLSRDDDRSATSVTSSIFHGLKIPQCKGPYLHSLYWTQSLYGAFISRRPNHRLLSLSQPPSTRAPLITTMTTTSPQHSKESIQIAPAAYTVVHSLGDYEELFAPSAILIVVLWLAVLMIGLVECVSVFWDQWARPERLRLSKRCTKSAPDYEVVVIDAVPLEDGCQSGYDWKGYVDDRDECSFYMGKLD